MHPDFGKVIIFEECPTNLISLQALRQHFKIEYSDENDGFKATSHHGTTRFYFDGDEEGLYELRDIHQSVLTALEDESNEQDQPQEIIEASHDLQDEASHDLQDEAPHDLQDETSHDMSDDVEKSDDSQPPLLDPQPITTIIPFGPSKQDVQRAQATREICRRAGHPGKEALIRAIKSGTFIEADITVRDVTQAEKILGPCQGCKGGKMTQSKRGYERPHIETQITEPINEILHADLFFIPGPAGTTQIILISVGQLSRLIIVGQERHSIN